MNEMMIFEGNEVMIEVIDGEPMFEIYSMGLALGYAKSNGYKLYPQKDRIEKVIENAEISTCVHGVHEFITESQMYDFIFEAKTEKCKPFRKWVVEEVLPSIRKNGAYLTDNMIEQVLTDPDTIIRLATQLKEERIKTKLLETTIEEQKPLVEFSETILKSKDNISMDNMAKLLKDEGLDIGRNRLFEFLRQQKVLNSNNIPYQNYMNKDWFTLTEKTNNTAYGVKIFTVVLVTPKGQVGIATLVRNKY